MRKQGRFVDVYVFPGFEIRADGNGRPRIVIRQRGFVRLDHRGHTDTELFFPITEGRRKVWNGKATAQADTFPAFRVRGSLSTMEATVKVFGHESATVFTLDLFRGATLSARLRHPLSQKVMTHISECVNDRIAEYLPATTTFDQWKSARTKRQARSRAEVPPMQQRGHPQTSAVMWAYRAQIAARSAAPATDLEEFFGAPRRTVQGWLQQMTGARNAITDLEGKQVTFLCVNGPQKQPSYEATDLAKTIATIL